MSPRYEGIINGHGIVGIAANDRFDIGERDSRSLKGTSYHDQSGFHKVTDWV